MTDRAMNPWSLDRALEVTEDFCAEVDEDSSQEDQNLASAIVILKEYISEAENIIKQTKDQTTIYSRGFLRKDGSMFVDLDTVSTNRDEVSCYTKEEFPFSTYDFVVVRRETSDWVIDTKEESDDKQST